MPPSSSAVAAITPIKVPASSCQPPVSWSHRPPSWPLLVFTVPGPMTARRDTEHRACQQRGPQAMEPLVEAQTSMVVSIGLDAVNRRSQTGGGKLRWSRGSVQQNNC